MEKRLKVVKELAKNLSKRIGYVFKLEHISFASKIIMLQRKILWKLLRYVDKMKYYSIAYLSNSIFGYILVKIMDQISRRIEIDISREITINTATQLIRKLY